MTMRDSILTGLVLGLFLSLCPTLFAQPSPLIRPTAEQVEAAVKAFDKMGGRLEKRAESQIVDFVMPPMTTDGDLKLIPPVPFSFGLYLGKTKVTDAGLKELAG